MEILDVCFFDINGMLPAVVGALVAAFCVLVGWVLVDRLKWAKREVAIDDNSRNITTLGSRVETMPSEKDHRRLLDDFAHVRLEVLAIKSMVDQLDLIIKGLPGQNVPGVIGGIQELRQAEHALGDKVTELTLKVETMRREFGFSGPSVAPNKKGERKGT